MSHGPTGATQRKFALPNVRFVPKADILPAVLSVGLIVRPDAHDVVGEMGVRVNSSLIRLS